MPVITFGDFSVIELAEFDLSLKWKNRKTVLPKIREDDSFSKFKYIWAERAQRKPAEPKKSVYELYTPRERLSYGLKKKFAGRPYAFRVAFGRFLGDEGRMRVISPFYKEIYDSLVADVVRDFKRSQTRKMRREQTASIRRVSYGPNRFSVLKDYSDRTLEAVVDPDDLVPCSPPVRQKKMRTIIDIPFIGPLNLPPPPRKRSETLLAKLHLILHHLRGQRTGQQDLARQKIVKVLTRLMELEGNAVQPQMDEEVVVDKKSNVITMNTQGQEVVDPLEVVVNDFWSKASTSDTLHRYPELSDRWHLLTKNSWTSNDGAGKTLFEASLPFDFLKDNKNSPNFVPFAQYAYWKGDISIRVHINTTMFNVGSLIVSWYYGEDFDSFAQFRKNRGSMIQLPHALINASSSNDVILNIPFRNYKSMLSMYKKKNDVHYAAMGKLRLAVFNPLILSSADGTTSVPYAIYVSFPNSEFSGLIPRDDSQFDVEPQMFPLIKAKKIVNFASDAMDMLIPDPNRDNPPVENRPVPIAPIASGSWSSGNLDVDCVNLMRLEPTGQTPHPRGSTSQDDEMSIDYVKQRKGLICSVDWTTSFEAGKILKQLPASPIQTCYEDVEVKIGNEERNCKVYTPVHNLANMFGFWRGELDLEIEIVSSPLQVGSLIIGFCPRRSYTLDNTNSLSNIKSMYHVVVDLETQNNFVFRIPYIADKPWWPVVSKKNSDSVSSSIDAPGTVFICVLNPLICNKAAVPEQCWINLFMKAAPSFEVSLVTNPRIGLCFNVSYNKSKLKEVKISGGYEKEFAIGTWRYLKNNAMCFRYGSGSDHITQFSNLKPGIIYKMVVESPLVPEINYQIVDKSARNAIKARKGKPLYLVRFIVNGDRDTYEYGAPFVKHEEAVQFINHMSSDAFADTPDEYMIRKDTNDYIILTNNGEGYVWAPDIESIVEPQMDSPILLNTASSTMQTTMSGRLTFGERVDSLKSICRRYQHYKSYDFQPQILGKTNSLSRGILIPLKPDGLKLDVNNFIENFRREGLIGYVCSAYRFFRGSLRFRIVFKNVTKGMVYVQHIYDQEVDKDEIVLLDDSRKVSHMLQPGYAMCAQNLGLNNTLSIEIPFYLPSNLGLLQNPISSITKIESVVKSLGFLYLNYESDASTLKGNVYFDMFYSFGDDMALSCFIGFPPVFEVSGIESDSVAYEDGDFDIVPQMGWLTNSDIPACSEKSAEKLKECIVTYGEASEDTALQEPMKRAAIVIATESKFGEYVESYIVHLKRNKNAKLVDLCKKKPKDLYKHLYVKYKKTLAVSPPMNMVGELEYEVSKKIAWDEASLKQKLDLKIDEKMSKFSKNIVNDSKETVRDLIQNENASIWDYISSIAEIIGGEVKHLILSSFIHVMHVIANPTLKTFVIAIVGVLTSLGLICTSVISKLISCMEKVYKNVFDMLKKWTSKEQQMDEKPSCSPFAGTPNKTETGDEVVGQMASNDLNLDVNDKAALLATIVGGITSVVGCKKTISTKSMPDFCSTLFKDLSQMSRGCNQLTIFFRNNLEMFSKILKYITHKIFPRKNIQLTLDDEKDYYKAWIEDCNELLHPDNADAVLTNPQMNVRVYQAAVVAEAYKMKYLVSDVRPSPIFMQIVTKLTELRDKLATAKISPPVRFEPWTLCFAGESNIGKSHLADRVATELLEAINYQSFGEKIYTRTPGNPYWNGCRAQPVVLYDDFLQMTTPEQRAQDIAELFCLKSKAVFNPPQAAIEDKHIRYNPLVVMMMMNEPFQNIPQCSSQKAWRRRRDVLITVRVHSQYVGLNPREIDPEISKNYGHLRFDVHKSSVEDKKDYILDCASFDELMRYLKERFINFYRAELVQYNERLEAATKFMPRVDESIEQTIDRYKKHLELINANCKHKDFDTIFDSEKYKNMTMPDYLVLNAQQHVQGQMDDDCAHHTVRPDWMYYHDFNAVLQAKQDNDRINLPDPETGVFSAFCNTAYGYDVYVDALPCKDNPDCFWVKDGGFHHKKFMEEWQKKNKILFDAQNVAVKEGSKDQLIPLYFTKSKSNTPAVYHDQIMEQLTNELKKLVEDNKSNLVEEAEKKGIKYKLLRTGKWLLRQVLRVVGFAIMFTASMGLVNIFGRMFNIAPYDNESRALVHNYVTSSGSGRTNVAVSEKIKTFFQTPMRKPQGQMAYDLKVPMAAKVAITPKALVAGQMATDVENVIHNHLSKNTFFLTVHKKDGRQRTLRCLGVCQRFALVLDHYVFEYSREDICFATVKYRGVEQTINIHDIRSLFLDQSSLVLIEMPSYIAYFKDIRSCFINSSLSANIPADCKIFELTLDHGMRVHSLPLSFKKQLVIPNDNHPDTKLEVVYEYPLSQQGLCCSVVCTTMNTSAPIIGLHVAGTKNGKWGYAEPICRETIMNVVEQAMEQSRPVDFVSPQYGPVENSKLKFDFNVQQIGTVSNKLMHHAPKFSKHCFTECAEQINPVTYDFPLLHDKDPRIASEPFSPMLIGCSFHCMNPIPFKNKVLDQAVDYYRTKILANVVPLKKEIGVLSLEQAIVGIHGQEHYDSLEFSTSEGFPLVADRPAGASDKRWLFDLEQIQDGWKLNGISPKLTSILEMKQKMRERGIIPFTVFTDCLKDLKLPAEKCLVPGKTRIFSISPVDFTIQCRQYFMDFAVAYQEARFKVDHAIGIDCNSMEWTALAQNLLNISNNIVVADYTKFGPTLMAACVHKAFEIIIDWYKFNGDSDPINELVRRCMCEETKFSVHLMLNLLYQVNCGSPSGHPLTTIINSIVNCLYVLYSFLELGFNIKEYDDNVKLITYGDDLIMSVSDEFISKFNCESMSEVLWRYAIKLTDASKTGDIVQSRSLLDPDVTFLKRRFILHPKRRGVYLAQLDKRAVLEVCNWTFKSSNLREKSIESCQAMLENAFGFGKKEYEVLRRKVIDWWLKRRVPIVIPSWDEVDERCFGTGSVRF
ncbi:polyprotein [Exitianus exitiosus virus 2]|nr:polyprotein [Exitianus exitiosus virus 2]